LSGGATLSEIEDYMAEEDQEKTQKSCDELVEKGLWDKAGNEMYWDISNELVPCSYPEIVRHNETIKECELVAPRGFKPEQCKNLIQEAIDSSEQLSKRIREARKKRVAKCVKDVKEDLRWLKEAAGCDREARYRDEKLSNYFFNNAAKKLSIPKEIVEGVRRGLNDDEFEQQRKELEGLESDELFERALETDVDEALLYDPENGPKPDESVINLILEKELLEVALRDPTGEREYPIIPLRDGNEQLNKDLLDVDGKPYDFVYRIQLLFELRRKIQEQKEKEFERKNDNSRGMVESAMDAARWLRRILGVE